MLNQKYNNTIHVRSFHSLFPSATLMPLITANICNLVSGCYVNLNKIIYQQIQNEQKIMKLKISTFKEPKHIGVVVCVNWNNTEDVFSCG